MRITEANVGRKHALAALDHRGLAYSFLELGFLWESRAHVERWLKVSQDVLPDKHPEIAEAYASLGYLLADLGDYAGAREQYERALALRKSVLGPTHPNLVTPLIGIGLLDWRLGNPYLAHRHLQEALRICEQMLGPAHVQTASVLLNLAILESWRGQSALAAEYRKRGTDIVESTKRHSGETVVDWIGLSYLQEALNRSAKSDYVRQREEAIVRSMEAPEPGRSYTSGGTVGVRGGSQSGPERSSAWTVEVDFWQLFAGSSPPRAGTNRAEDDDDSVAPNVLPPNPDLVQGLRAAPDFRQAIARFKREHGANPARVASYSNGWGLWLLDRDRPDEARELFEEALAQRTQVLGPNHPDTAVLLANLGVARMRTQVQAGATRSFAAARQPLLDALTIREQALGPRHPDTARSLVALAELHWASGSPTGAKDYLLRALAIDRDVFLRGVAAARSDNEIHEFLATMRPDFDKILSLCDQSGDLPTVFEHVLAWQGAGTSAEKAWRDLERLDRELSAADQRDLQRFREASRRLQLIETTPAGSAAGRAERRRQLQRAQEELTALEQSLAARSEPFRTRRDILLAKPADVCSRLRSTDAALVIYVRYDRFDPRQPGNPWQESRYLAVVVPPQDCRVQRVELGDGDDIDRQVDAYQDAAGTVAECVAAQPRRNPAPWCAKQLAALDLEGRALRRRLWDPLRRHLPDAGRVYLVPDGRLTEVSFSGFPTDDGRYLLEQREIAYLSWPAQLLEAPRTGSQRNRQSAFVVGDPDFRNANAEPFLAQLERDACPLAAAPKARRGATGSVLAGQGTGTGCGYLPTEWDSLDTGAQDVAASFACSTFEAVSLATGPDASEQILKQELPGKSQVFVSTHGYFAPAADCREPRDLRKSAALEPLSAWARRDPSPPIDPLSLAGLVLAGANRGGRGTDPANPGNDGILTGREISELNLRAAELVVLSACETGRGETIAGEGAFGLGRAFQVAGARSVVVSLWQVPVTDTTRLFQRFYGQLLSSGGDPVASLRASQLALLRELRQRGIAASSFLWAAFVPVGAPAGEMAVRR